MCGIIGYTGETDCPGLLVDGLRQLEYRGYDSCGIAVLNGGKILCEKRAGRVRTLQGTRLHGKCGIGHTRWATHGKPTAENAHPHISRDGRWAVVHNGIIENAAALRESAEKKGYVFRSETDTEVVCALLWEYGHLPPLQALGETVKKLCGSFALAVLHAGDEAVYCAKQKSPLLLGRGDGENLLASDVSALSGRCREVYRMADGELAEVTKDGIRLFTFSGEPVERTFLPAPQAGLAHKKDGFAHFMLKEIYEQPGIFRRILAKRLQCGAIQMPELDEACALGIDKILFCGCGSAYHVGIAGKYLVEELCGITCEAVIASEFRYKKNVIGPKTLFVAISQSGETADTLESLLLAKKCGAKTLGIVNVENASIAKESGTVLYTEAGTETAVATTKAYTAQLLYVTMLALRLTEKKDENYQALLHALPKIPAAAEQVLVQAQDIQKIAKKLSGANDMYFIGRNLDYAAATEAALKLKEISYIHCEAFPAGELKHGTISLVERGTPIFAVNCRDDVFAKTLSNAEETRARGAEIYELRCRRHAHDAGENTILIDDLPAPLLPCVQAVALQLCAYYCALEKGCDIDKPRNLAKSVTVE